jgi:hypothetical protein
MRRAYLHDVEMLDALKTPQMQWASIAYEAGLKALMPAALLILNRLQNSIKVFHRFRVADNPPSNRHFTRINS